MFLSSDELQELTHRVRPSAQVRALRAMGIEHRVRPADGTVAVLLSHVEEVMGGKWSKSLKARAIEPNWSAINK